MDREVIDQKLDSLRRCIERIRTKLPLTSETFKTDFDVQDIVSLNLTRAVQMAVDIGAHIVSSQQQVSPGSMGETFDQLGQLGVISADLALQLKKSVGFRNIAVHNYNTINWDIVQSIVQVHLKDFDQFAKAIVHYLQGH
ncbi:DUF86 domain-containing protein [Limnohabitans sp. Rim8]|uniref:type VII toxin-antitoxin system HepT family RNase toxin n=1 Tax=Limnohabitans sp. Rim8 TaxID=1100718 RepID=UPI003305E7FC